MDKILITGSLGQIGSELALELRKRYGNDNVVVSDIRRVKGSRAMETGPFELLDCTDSNSIANIVKKYKIDTIYHLAAILSANAEKNPQLAWNININGLYNVLEVARELKCSVFTPSSIGAFGPSTPKDGTPQDTIQRPTTMYGVTKVSGELLCDYYYKRFGVDTRGVRYPGLISYVAPPGGGTTDYAVEIFYEALKHKRYTCYLKEGTYLDMMYMPDGIKAAIDVMEANPDKLIHRNAFNVTAMNFAPEHIAAAIRKIIPDFIMDYAVDPVRQNIADSWPNYMDDSAAREEWGWRPDYDLDSMTKDMIEKLSQKLNVKP
ncbi:L-threonine 3-dehydrogenase [candidate division WOR-3 bacterium]|nr:L-threonine 3-dehydrogenase [candidate division WOR-3 bacterium]